MQARRQFEHRRNEGRTVTPLTTPYPFGSLLARALPVLFLVTALAGADAHAARYTSTVAGGIAFRDKIKNGQPDDGEIKTEIDRENGSFKLPLRKGRLYVTGGTDLVSGQPNTALLSAPPAARAVGTLTSLWQALLDRKQGGGKIKKLLNVPKGATVANFVAKPLADVPQKKQTLIKRNAQHHTLVSFLKSLAGKPGSAKLRNAQRLAAKVQATPPPEDREVGALADALLDPEVAVKGLQAIDWTDPATLEKIVGLAVRQLGIPLTPDEVTQAAKVLAEQNQKIEDGNLEPFIPFPNVVAVAGGSQPEGTPLAYTVTLAGASPIALTLDFAVAGGTAANADYGTPGFSDGASLGEAGLTVPAGVTEFTVTFPTVDDTLFEGPETLLLTVGGVSATGTIGDNDSAPSIAAVTGGSATEGEVLALAVALSNAAASPQSFDFALAGATAADGHFGPPSFSDGVTYDGETGKITVPALVTDFTVNLPSSADDLHEPDETVTVSVGGIEAMATVEDDDPLPTIATVDDASSTEGTALVHAVTLTNPSSSPLTFTFELAGNSASTADFGAPAFSDGVALNDDGSITVPAGITGFTVTVPTVDDSLDEAAETVDLAVGEVPATGTITDNDGVPAIASVTGGSSTEGAALTFAVSLSNASSSAIGFDFALAGTTADADDFGTPAFGSGVVYDAANGRISVPAGVSAFTVSLPTTDDSVDEDDETLSVSVGGVDATGTIVDDDGAPAVASVTGDNRTEGGTLALAVTLSNPASAPVSFDFSLTPETAQSADIGNPSFSDGVSHDAEAGTLTVPAGVSAFTVSVPTLQDAVAEASETVIVSVGGIAATGTIIDDDGVPEVASVSSDSQTEGTALVHTVTLSNTASSAITVSFTLAGNTASADDFGTATLGGGVSLNADGSLNIPADTGSFTITVPTTADTVDEANETLIITVGTATGTGTIVDDDGAPEVASVGADSKTEGTALSFAVALSNGSASATTFAFSLAGDTAAAADFGTPAFTAGVTYDATAGEISVPAGVTGFSVTVPTTADTVDEPNETLTITVGTVSASGTIVDNDDAPTVDSVSADSKAEGTALGFAVALSNGSASATTFAFSLAGDTAAAADFGAPAFTAGVTYDATAGEISVPAGVTGFTVTVPTTADTVDEPNETLTITVGTASATGTIVDNDDAPTVTAVSADSTTEGTALAHTVTLSNSSSSAVSLDFSLTGNTAQAADFGTPSFSAGVTYSAATGQVTVPANVTSFVVTIPTIDDDLDETDETLRLIVDNVGNSGTIVDNDGTPAIASITGDSKTEGTALIHTVTLSNAASTATSFDFSLTGETAAAGDFGVPSFSAGVTHTAATGQISVPAGVTSFTVTVPTTQDTAVEADETITLAIGTATAAGTIRDDDQATVTAVEPGAAGTGDDGVTEGGNLVYTVTLSDTTARPASYGLTLGGGSAAAADYGTPAFGGGVTFDAGAQTVSVPAGLASFTVTLPTVDDGAVEPAETVPLTVGGVTGTGRILDNDVPAITAIEPGAAGTQDDAVTEGQPLVYSVTLATPPPTPATYPLSLTGGTAAAADYTALSAASFSDGVTYNASAGTITVPANLTSFTITVATVDDTEVEATETLPLALGSSSGPGRILDNDQPAVASVEAGAAGTADNSVTEGSDLVYSVTLSTATQSPASYPLALRGSAIAESDYQPAASFSNGVTAGSGGTIRVPAGVTRFTVTYVTVDDAAVESAETLDLIVGGVTGAGGILDNDPTIERVAGVPDKPGHDGDGAAATSALLSQPAGVAAAGDGGLFIADAANHRIRRVDRQGVISTVAGTGGAGFGGDDKPAVDALLNQPMDVVADSNGNLYIADTANHAIRRVDTATGLIATVAGIAGSPGYNGDNIHPLEAQLNFPTGLALVSDYLLYIADSQNHRVRLIDLIKNVIVTVAGFGEPAYGGDGFPAIRSGINVPLDVAVDSSGAFYIADSANHVIRRVSAQGVIDTFAGVPEKPGYGGDGGPALKAQLNGPRGLALGLDGSLYLADAGNAAVRRVDPAGNIATVAGLGTPGYGGDGGPAVDAQLDGPFGLAVGAHGNLFVADTGNHIVRRLPTLSPIYADSFDLDAAKNRTAGADLGGLPVLVSNLGATPWASLDLGSGGSNTLAGDAANGYVLPNPEPSSSLLSLPATLAAGSYQLSARLYPDSVTRVGSTLGLGFFAGAKPATLQDPTTIQLMLLLSASPGFWQLYAPGFDPTGLPALVAIQSNEIFTGGWSAADPPTVTLTWNTAAKTASAAINGVYLFENLDLSDWGSDATAVKAVGIPRDQAMGTQAVIDDFRFSRVLPP